MKYRLDQVLAEKGLVASRSQAESSIKLGQVQVNGQLATKSGQLVDPKDKIKLTAEQYVSRAGHKLASVSRDLGLQFDNKLVLDVGSSTGGFTEYALKHGARKVVAVDVGTEQLHPSLRLNPRIELHEQTDIRQVGIIAGHFKDAKVKINKPDIVLMDLSFISLREILPHIKTLCQPHTQVVAMVKPQFEAGRQQINKGVIKNERVRRTILKDFEQWVQGSYLIKNKKDSEISGSKGNRERFYLLAVVK